MSSRLTLQQVAKLLRDQGITGSTLITLTAASVVESGPGANADPNGPLYADWKAVNTGDAKPPKWGASYNFLQIRSLQPGRPELSQGYAHRDRTFLQASPENGAIAVAAVLREPGAGLHLWSSISSGDYRPFVPAATAAAASLGGTDVAAGGAEVAAVAPQPAATPPPTASLVAGMAVYGPTELTLEGENLSGLVKIVTADLDRTIDDAPNLVVQVVDDHNRLLDSGLINIAARTSLDGILFQLHGVARYRRDITLTMLDAAAAEYISDIADAPIVQAPDTGSRGDFLRMLAKRHPWVPVDIETGATPDAELAVNLGESIWAAMGRIADEVGWRRTVVANRLLIGSEGWLASRRPPLQIREGEQGVDRIEFDFLAGEASSRAVVICDAALWSAPPTTAVEILDLGPASGEWLVVGARKKLSAAQAAIELGRVQPPLPEPVAPPPPAGYSEPAGTPAGGQVVPGPVSGQGWQWPMAGRISSQFGNRVHPITGNVRLHAGLDIANSTGTPIYAARAGTVTVAGTAGGYGLAVYLDHGGGTYTRYGHMSSVGVTRGQQVQQGQKIGLCGSTGQSTGPHLHFEIRPGDTPVNPLPLLPAR